MSAEVEPLRCPNALRAYDGLVLTLPSPHSRSESSSSDDTLRDLLSGAATAVMAIVGLLLIFDGLDLALERLCLGT